MCVASRPCDHEEIARTAGCSEALLYKHFPDKRDILLRVQTERSPRIDVATGLPGTGTVVANLERLVADFLEFSAQRFPIAASVLAIAQELRLGRLPAVDTDVISRLLTGAALHEAFLATCAGEPIPDIAPLADRLVTAVDLISPRENPEI